MTQSKTDALRASVNIRAFLQKAPAFFSAHSWISELLQNAYRSRASNIGFFLDTAQLVVTDNGSGIQPDAWANLLEVSSSGWDEGIQVSQGPAGMGILAVLLNKRVCIESCGWALQTVPDDIIQRKPLKLQASEWQQGTRVTVTEVEGGPLHLPVPQASVVKRYFSCLVYQCDSEEPLNLEIVTPEQSYKGSATEMPWVAKNVVPQKQVSLRVPSRHGELGEVPCMKFVEVVLPAYRAEGVQIVPSLVHVRAADGMVVYFHGQSIRIRCPFSKTWGQEQLTYAITVRGKTLPFNPKLPDRQEIIQDEKWAAFMEVFRDYHENIVLASIDRVIGVEKAVPVLKLLGKFRKGEFNDPESLYYNDIQDETIHGFRQVASYAPELWHSTGVLTSVPSLYEELDFVLPNSLPWVHDDTDYEEETIDTPEGCADLVVQAVPRALEALARQGTLCLGVREDGTRGERQDWETARYREFSDFLPLFTDKCHEVFFPDSFGGHVITVYRQLLVREIESGKEWEVTHPCIVNATDGSNYPTDASFFANHAYLALMRQNPGEAFRLFKRALFDGFVQYDDLESPYYPDHFEVDCRCERIRPFFDLQHVDDRFVYQMKGLLAQLDPELEELLKNKATKLYLKKVVYTSKGLELQATVEGKDRVCKVSSSLGDVQIQWHTRSLPQKGSHS